MCETVGDKIRCFQDRKKRESWRRQTETSCELISTSVEMNLLGRVWVLLMLFVVEVILSHCGKNKPLQVDLLVCCRSELSLYERADVALIDWEKFPEQILPVLASVLDTGFNCFKDKEMLLCVILTFHSDTFPICSLLSEKCSHEKSQKHDYMGAGQQLHEASNLHCILNYSDPTEKIHLKLNSLHDNSFFKMRRFLCTLSDKILGRPTHSSLTSTLKQTENYFQTWIRTRGWTSNFPVLTRKTTADWASLWLFLFSFWSAAFVSLGDEWDGWQTTVRVSLAVRDRLPSFCLAVYCNMSARLCLWICIHAPVLFVVGGRPQTALWSNKHIKFGDYVETTADAPAV